MAEHLTKSAARNIFYGGSLFFFVIFVGLVAQSFHYATTVSETDPITPAVAHGKRIWERHACFDCHTLFGEGARFAPELGHVWQRYGGVDDPDGTRERLKDWIKSQPSRVEGRHQMPHFDLSETELDDLVEFLRHASTINTQNWPPKG
ncbi:cytochrome c [Telmatospirillum sp.]|uniref:c-type cytochrome n=1 Tax=Telmatospirillum sp. TaxID=2079197 RepID=UPI00283DD202|nr:cytochrome c [Telmatospirillum sp.]MDR3435115.1 cytochrome c [Telmatospirillum sp.]